MARRDKRRAERQRKRLTVRFWWDDLEGSGFTQDVSESGLLVETSKDLELGTRVHVELTGDNLAFFANAVVVRKKQYPRQARSLFKPALGLRFEKITEALQHARDAEERKPAEPQEKPEAAGEATGKPARKRAAKSKRSGAPAAQKPAAQDADPVYETKHLPMEVDLRRPERLAEIYEEDVKHGGLRVRTTEIREIDSEVVVPVLLPEPFGSIACSGTVVKIMEELPGFAIRLDDIDAVRARLIEIIRTD